MSVSNAMRTYRRAAWWVVPMLPLLIFQARGVKRRVPRLPNAEGPEGVAGTSFSTKNFNLLFLGESTVAGVGVDRHEMGLAGKLGELLSQHLERPVQWRVCAESGYTVRAVRKLILPDISWDAVDCIVLGLGGNDAFALHSPEKFIAECDALVTELRREFGEVPIVFLDTPPISQFPAFTPLMKRILGGLSDLLGNALEEYTQGHRHLHFARRSSKFGEKAAELGVQKLFSDGVHPSQLTYQMWAEDTVNYMVAAQIGSTEH
ncbi:MAG: SGNH/GDSL hydrolase family protein [Cryomorphaceae bacterium]|nr:MAG: SGNH/GDSL hydrolase family protein [Cryomorphaceae bacterium]